MSTHEATNLVVQSRMSRGWVIQSFSERIHIPLAPIATIPCTSSPVAFTSREEFALLAYWEHDRGDAIAKAVKDAIVDKIEARAFACDEDVAVASPVDVGAERGGYWTYFGADGAVDGDVGGVL